MNPMRRGLLAALLAASAGVSHAAPAELAVGGARLALPAEADWTVQTAADAARATRLLGDGQLEVTLTVRPRAAGAETGTAAEFLRQAEKAQDALMTAAHEMRSVHFSQVRQAGTPCVRWDGVFAPRGVGAAAQPQLWRAGLTCLHPMATGLAVTAEAVWRAPANADAEPALQAAQLLLSGLAFQSIRAAAGSALGARTPLR